MHVINNLRQLSLLAFLTLLPILALPNFAIADLSMNTAKSILEDTSLISTYLDLKGESDYAKSQVNIVKAALFGAFDTKYEFTIEQEQRKNFGKKRLPKNAILLKVNGKSLTADMVLLREEAPAVFKNHPDNFNCFITKEAVALAALYFTGHNLRNHIAPKGDKCLGETLLTDKGYFVSIEGLGDPATESVLKKIEPKDDGYILTGDVVEVMDDSKGTKSGTFRLRLTPGDVQGVWKRQYSEKKVRR